MLPVTDDQLAAATPSGARRRPEPAATPAKNRDIAVPATTLSSGPGRGRCGATGAVVHRRRSRRGGRLGSGLNVTTLLLLACDGSRLVERRTHAARKPAA